MRSGGHITAVIAIFIFLVGAFYILAPKGAKVEESQVIEKCIPTGQAGEVIQYNNTSYKQIRAQVQIEAKFFKNRSYSNLVESNLAKDLQVFDIYRPTNVGKTAARLRSPQFSQIENQSTDKFYLMDAGLIFYVLKDPTTLQPKTLTVGGLEFWKTHIYQDVSKLSSKPVPSEIFYCPDSQLGGNSSPVPTPQVRVYEPQSSGGKQLQLDFFDFSSNPTPLDPTLVLIE